MKRVFQLLVCVSLLGFTTGCCWMHGPCGGGACGTCPGGFGGYAPGAYATGSSITATAPTDTTYAYGPIYPTTAALPVNSLPTY